MRCICIVSIDISAFRKPARSLANPVRSTMRSGDELCPGIHLLTSHGNPYPSPGVPIPTATGIGSGRCGASLSATYCSIARWSASRLRRGMRTLSLSPRWNVELSCPPSSTWPDLDICPLGKLVGHQPPDERRVDCRGVVPLLHNHLSLSLDPDPAKHSARDTRLTVGTLYSLIRCSSSPH